MRQQQPSVCHAAVMYLIYSSFAMFFIDVDTGESTSVTAVYSSSREGPFG